MAKLDFQRNFKFWTVVAILLTVDIVMGWIAFSKVLIPEILATNGISLIGVFIGINTVLIALFYFNNRYKVDPTLSRFAEIENIFKVTLGTILFVILFNELFELPVIVSSTVLLRYWITLAVTLSAGRLIIRQIQKSLLKKGYGAKNTIIVGVNERAKKVAEYLTNRHLGYKVVGFVTPDPIQKSSRDQPEQPILASVNELKQVIDNFQINEVIIAFERPNHNRLLDIITLANGSPVSLKIIPDMYEVVSGLAKTEQIHGLPLIQINPEIISRFEKFLKRFFDILSACIVIIPLMPFWFILALAIKINSRGPIFYWQDRIGMDGKQFKIVKFRSMFKDAETHTGPIWAAEDDPRITNVGYFMRRFRLDEVPQFLNVLSGQMSVVGPRPERPYFVQKLMEEFPFYYRRHKVRPGITGWAQIKRSYDTTIEDVRQKLKYDFFYIENISISLDLKIMFNTVAVMFSGKGQ
ncbi:MAG: sugar transferase [Candidatus Marinimicrobia bacterium]|nr:sugar transferase [Candidatus Neomarinimicrobiota bacterium]